MSDHRSDCHLGEHSPLAKLYKMEPFVLLVGVGYEACSAFHLAEYRYIESPPQQIYSCAVSVNGQTQWIQFADVVLDDRDFRKIGADLDLDHGAAVKNGYVGNAPSHLIPLVLAVDYASRWMAEHRV